MTTDPSDVTPFADDVHAVAEHCGVATRDVNPAPVQGQVNLTVFLGDDLVLRIPRTPRAAEQLAKEAEVIPLVRSAGVPTAELLRYDSTLQIGSSPYMLLQRVHGAPLSEQPLDGSGRRRALHSLGEILVALHRIRFSKIEPVEAIPAPYTFSPAEVLHRLVEAGEIGTVQQDWLQEQFTRLRPAGPGQGDPVLLHRDVIPSNVMVDHHGRVTALLDWGCAEWGAPARDLVGLPLRDLPDLLSGYWSALREGPSEKEGHDELERDVLWYQLYLALTRLLKEPSTSEDRNWAAPRTATLLDLLAFTSDATTESWPELLRRTSEH